jgi:DUF4097 and DUF4098 domain-containing protein YvlB
MPKTRVSKILISLLTLLCFASLAVAQDKDKYKDKDRKHWRGINISTNNEDSNNCEDHIRIHSDDELSVVRGEEMRTLPNQALNVSASRNGGIHVRNWDKPEISVKLCKSVGARSESVSRQMLDQIKLNVQGTTISVDGPESKGSWQDDTGWSTVLLIYAPVGSTLNMEAHNGGISLKNVDGNYKARTQNGGVSLVQARGKLDVETTNGGVSIKDCGGDVKATVRNGGMSIELGETWSGSGLEARTQNGGLVVAVPKAIQSGVEISMSKHSGVVCQADACDSGQRTWDDDGRTIRFGSGNTIIRASTVNGGTVIKERGRKVGSL